MALKLRGGTSALRREHALRWWIEPVASAWFRLDDSVQALVIGVAQYWDDEASDAVHLRFFPARSASPAWPEDVHTDRAGYEAAVTEATGASPPWRVAPTANEDLVPAFAACCRPDAHQDMDWQEAFRPWVVVRRAADGVSSEVVGDLRQPWWEDRFWMPSRAPEATDAEPLQSRVRRGLSVEALLRALDAASELPAVEEEAWALVRATRAWDAGRRFPGVELERVQARLRRSDG